MDHLTLKGLRYHAKHGYYEEERQKGNRFEVDIVFERDFKQESPTDRLSDTVNYEEAEEIVREVMEGPQVKLIETLAGKIGKRLFEKFTGIKRLTVTLRKLKPPLKTESKYAEISLTWQR